MTAEAALKLDAFHAERRTGIGGSDAAAILGLSPWKAPIQVFEEKLALVEAQPPTPQMEWGTALEGVIRRHFTRVTGLPVVEHTEVIRHPEHDWMIAHVDGLVYEASETEFIRPVAVFEAKTAGTFAADDFGEPGTDQVPDAYLVQCQHYMAVTGLPKTYLAVLVGGNDFRVYVIPRDEEIISQMMLREREFWFDHVIQEVPPPVDYSAAYEGYLRRRYPVDSGEIRQADEAAEGWCRELAEVRARLDLFEAREQGLKTLIQNYLGDASVLECSLGKISWKKTKDGERTDWRAVARELAESFAPRGALDQIVLAHTEPKPGVRRFLVNFKEGE